MSRFLFIDEAAVGAAVYIGYQGASNTLSWVNAPIGAGAANRIIVIFLHYRSTLSGVTISSVTVGGTPLSEWSGGTPTFNPAVSVNEIKIWYGVIAASGPATITVTQGGALTTAVEIEVYSVTGCSSTPVDQVIQNSENDTDINLLNIACSAGGIVLAMGCADEFGAPTAVTFTESWTGVDAVIEDDDRVGFDSNADLVCCHINTTAASTTDDLTITLSAARLHIGAAISFGP